MVQIRGYIASSLDGYIARLDGAVDWLARVCSATASGCGGVVGTNTPWRCARSSRFRTASFGWTTRSPRSADPGRRDVSGVTSASP